MIGYMIEQELGNLLPFERPFATLLTMIEVDRARSRVPESDQVHRPGLRQGRGRPTRRRKELGLQAGRRQVAARGAVARTQAHLRASADQVAARAGNRSSSAAGGGGIPTMYDTDSRRRTLRALSGHRQGPRSELLARDLHADMFVMLTDADAVYVDWGTPNARKLNRSTPGELAAYEFPAGSMGPKIEAACEFATSTGRPAAIGALADIERIVAGEAGTLIEAA